MPGIVQLFVHGIPFDAENRQVRKSIGHALKLISGQLKPFKLDFNEKPPVLSMEDDGDKLKYRLVSDGNPIYCSGEQLFFTIAKFRDVEERRWSQKLVQAIRIQEVESDYESVHSDDEEEYSAKQLRLYQISCGAWDGFGGYVDAWRRRCDPDDHMITVDEDKGSLWIESPAGIICIDLFNIKYTISDENKIHYYIVLRALPTFLLREDDNKLVRVSSFGKEHDNCARYSYVYRFKYASSLEKFVSIHFRRLVEPDAVTIEASPYDKFQNKSMTDELFENYQALPFDTAFQVQSLISSWRILPMEALPLQASLLKLDKELGGERITTMGRKIGWRDPRPGKGRNNFGVARMIEFLETGSSYSILDDRDDDRDDDRQTEEELEADYRARSALYGGFQGIERSKDDVLIHSLTITPAGFQFSGPHRDSGNRLYVNSQAKTIITFEFPFGKKQENKLGRLLESIVEVDFCMVNS